jgi:CBS domain-containing protein
MPNDRPNDRWPVCFVLRRGRRNVRITCEEPMRASEIMTANPACVTETDSALQVAQLMLEHDCGCLPVVAGEDDQHVVGVVTDRDLAIRGFARGKESHTPVRELMTSDPCCCSPGDDVHDVERAMADRQIRRIVVADDDGRCVGIIAQADLARAAARREKSGVSDRDVARVVERVSAPSLPLDSAG